MIAPSIIFGVSFIICVLFTNYYYYSHLILLRTEFNTFCEGLFVFGGGLCSNQGG